MKILYVNLLYYIDRKPPTCFGHLLWPSSGRCFTKDILHHHHHVHEGLGAFPVPSSSKWSWSLRLFFGRPMFLRPFGLYHNACFDILFVSILCMCCSHFFWYCFISLDILQKHQNQCTLYFIFNTSFESHLKRNIYTGCTRRNVPDFGRVFLMLKYTDIIQNTYVQS